MKNHRIGYIDAMRGFTMILVVYSHIHLVGYHSLLKNSFNTFFILFRMPLFFFISGWVLYKISRIWDIKTIKTFLLNKFQVQIISTIVFFVLYVYLFELNIINALGAFKAGFWFTYTLFFYFLFYVISIIFSSLFNHNHEDLITIAFSFFILLIYYITIVDTNQVHKQIYEIIGIPQWRYYVFFVYGILVKKYYNSFTKITNNSCIISLIIVFFFMLYFFGGNISLPHFDTIKWFLYGFLGIAIILTTFRVNGSFFDSENSIARSMRYIGRHTLDIYLLHHFFLPRSLSELGLYFQTNSNPVLELFATLVLAMIVIAICLVVSKVLRVSPILGHYLFGQKI